MEIVAENRVGRRALRHIRALAMPRFVGTAGELKAQNYIRGVFQQEGCFVMDQPFTSSFFPLDVFPRLLTATVIFALVIGFFALPVLPAVSVETGLLTLLVLVLGTRWSRFVERIYGFKKFGTLRSKNIIAAHPVRNNHLNIVFTAHYDSKSQNYSGATRFTMYGALAILCALTAVALLAAVVVPIPQYALLVTLAPACVLFVLVGASTTSNASPGAYDNASGVSVLLELARTYAGAQPNANLVFVATGAEEAGLCGAVALMQNEDFTAIYPPERSIVINLDGVGSKGPLRVTDRYGIPPVKTGPQVARLVHDVAARFGIESKSNWLPVGAGMDHIPFSAHGYHSVTLSTAGWNPAFRAMHTRRDTLEKLDVTSLEYCFAVCQEIVDSIPYMEA
jgi:hypothetical protein